MERNKIIQYLKQASYYMQDVFTKGQDSFKQVEAIKILETIVIPELEKEQKGEE